MADGHHSTWAPTFIAAMLASATDSARPSAWRGWQRDVGCQHNSCADLEVAHRMRIMVVEDDERTSDYVRQGLAEAGHVVDVIEDGRDALIHGTQKAFDVIIVDRMLPGLDGLSLVKGLRSSGTTTPVLFLTAVNGVDDRVEGLESGGDDYLVKPFALEELLARLRSLLRRSLVSGDVGQQLKFSDLVLDNGTREVWRGTRPISLTRTEFHLLELLMRHPRQVLERNQILEEVWGYDFPTTANSLEVYVGYLRRKLEAEGESRLIHTVRGVGYSLRELPT